MYRETIGEADELLLTQVLKDFNCTKFFPPYEADFELQSRSADQHENGLTYRFETWQRRKPDQASLKLSSVKIFRQAGRNATRDRSPIRCSP